ncbi:MAG: FAD-dependent oxidoreductase [Phycisphaera sp.]|nr:FAD-dependent oxidoreductase [Phycisphaera sp.]
MTTHAAQPDAPLAPTAIAPTLTADAATRAAWDVIVLGAGPAGAAAAIESARAGARVLLIDKATFPRHKVCGCCVNRAAVTLLNTLGVGDAVRATGAAPLRDLWLATGGRGVALPLPGGVAVSRGALDAALVRCAVAEGVELLTGVSAHVDELTPDGRGVTWQTDGQTSRAVGRVVIVATGLGGRATDGIHDLRSHAARHARLGAATIIDNDNDNDGNNDGNNNDNGAATYPPGRVHMAVTRGGYVGVVRLEDGRLDVAAAFDPAYLRGRDGCGDAAARVLHDACLPPITGLDAARWRGTPELTRRPARAAAERVLLIGDAAGYVEPFTGEGIAWALASGRAAAPIAVEATRRAAWDARHERAWCAAHRRLLRGPQRRCRAIALLLRHPAAVRTLVGALRYAPRLVAPLVRSITTASPGRVPRDIDTRTTQPVA